MHPDNANAKATCPICQDLSGPAVSAIITSNPNLKRTMDNDLQHEARYISAIRAHENGDLGSAESVYRVLLDENPDNAELHQRLGILMINSGRMQEAASFLESFLARKPGSPAGHYNYAIALESLGKADAAMRNLQEAIRLQPDFNEAHHAIASLTLPYENYLKVLEYFHRWLKPVNYVEIGVETGRSMSLAMPPTACIGIDPDPQIKYELPTQTRIFAQTSDDFFNQYDLHAELDEKAVSMAFIDGMHHYDAALKDFINIERYSSHETVVLLHDCIPLDKATSGRKQTTVFWSGDTWKIIPSLKKYRPDLDIITIPAPPTGLAVITRLDRKSTVLRENLDRILDEYTHMDYSYLETDKDSLLNVVYDDWPSIQQHISCQTSSR